MKNIRPQYVTRQRITAVHVTPVNTARKGRRWTTKNGIDETGEIRPWGSGLVRSSPLRRSMVVGSSSVSDPSACWLVAAVAEIVDRPVRTGRARAGGAGAGPTGGTGRRSAP
jgi:hypothetical protein